MSKKKKRKIQWQQYIAMIFFMLIGAGCGILMAEYIDKLGGEDTSTGEYFFRLALLLVGMYAAIFLQIIIHEAGHMVFGFLTGYRFSSFRIGSYMWINDNGKLHFKRLSLAGTGGQCLMNPPDMKDGKIPYVLYNLGGSIMNIITAVLFWGIYLVCTDIPILPILLLMLSIIGIAFALMNGVPMRMGAVDNDGYNALSLGKEKEALRSFWIQMKVSNEQIKGIRLKDMPDEWFEVPDDEAMKNSMIAVMGVFACNRLIDQKRFQEANALMKKIMNMETGIVGLHRSLLMCDRIYCELIGENRPEKVDGMHNKQQKKFIKSMKKFPSVIRMEYAYALLREKDLIKAETIKEKFEQTAKTYPYRSDIESERELIRIADEAYKSLEKQMFVC